MTKQEALFEYLLRKADDSLILGHRLSEWCGHGPILEEDIAITNIALDLIGQATELYKYAAEVEDKGRDEDDLAFLRIEREYKNVLLVEQTNGDFGKTMIRQLFFDHFEHLLYEELMNSKDERIAAIATKTIKEIKYHIKHSSEWTIRLGDGTEESHNRVQKSVRDLSRFTKELFYQDEVDQILIAEGIIPDVSKFKVEYDKNIKAILDEATLELPNEKWQLDGGRKGVHSEHLGYLLTELQYMQRTYPGMKW
ncbi:1,2-phenylacetyl-CoA epoxidase subunit PaaC [Brumimicrobium aurantiacum]|uniref:Phenylacetate-CoA oxygenase subunit PaaI n=1 Tax=Brumimicrobium aurantiacum TaxID=1737063 RepID=A0A3E1EVT8_9FLAO|nr:1,2-phenylacetyl-CoA epoxidase subunit PaaC [Brumimicrobium aurantiacum]RFC53675.1 phenylacetate-CoA oxygenase subunit PaaI [Brumimicrobium aurantiacum]